MLNKFLVPLLRAAEILSVSLFGGCFGSMLYTGEATGWLVVGMIVSAGAAAAAAPFRDAAIYRAIHAETWRELRPEAMRVAERAFKEAGWAPANQSAPLLIPEEMLAHVDELAKSAEMAAQAAVAANQWAAEVRADMESQNSRIAALEEELSAEQYRREHAEAVLRGIGSHLAGNGYQQAIEAYGEAVAEPLPEAPPVQSDEPGPPPAFLRQPTVEDELREMLIGTQREPAT